MCRLPPGYQADGGANHPVARAASFVAPVRYLALAALRARPAALARRRSIWPRGRVMQISPIHSSFTPLIALALKLVRLTTEGDFPRLIVFRYRSPDFRRTAASSP